MKRYLILCFAILTVAALLSNPVQAQVDKPIGTIAAMEGAVDALRYNGELGKLNVDDPVYINDRIRTKSFSKVHIKFIDGSEVKLAPSTCMLVKNYELDNNNRRKDAVVKVMRGKIEAIVSRTSKPETFTIATPNSEGRVKGSDIFVFYQNGKTGVLVREGSIAVFNPSLPADKVDLLEDDFTLIPFKEAPEKPRLCLDAEMTQYEKDVSLQFAKKWVPIKGGTVMAAAITAITGEVRIIKEGASDWRPAKLDETIHEGDKLQTGDDGSAEVRMSNGNYLQLSPNTELGVLRLKYDPGSDEFENVFESENGKIKAVVEKLGAKSTFEVKTPVGVCGARGTIMYLDINRLTGVQAYYEGGLGFMRSDITGRSQTIAPGENAAINAAGVMTIPRLTTTSQRMGIIQSWRGNMIMQDFQAPVGRSITGRNRHRRPPPPRNLLLNNGDRNISFSDRPNDTLPFNQVRPPRPPLPPVNVPGYSAVMNLNNAASSPAFINGNIGVDVKSNGLWSGLITNGVTTGNGAASGWTMTFADPQQDLVVLTSAVPFPTTPSSLPVTVPVEVCTDSVIRGTDPNRSLSGTGNLLVRPDDTFSGSVHGTWQNTNSGG